MQIAECRTVGLVRLFCILHSFRPLLRLLWTPPASFRRYDNWIVVNLTLEALAAFAHNGPSLRKTLI